MPKQSKNQYVDQQNALQNDWLMDDGNRSFAWVLYWGFILLIGGIGGVVFKVLIDMIHDFFVR